MANLIFDKKRSLFVLIKNSLGSKFFRSLYFFDGKKSKDILKNGELSCAFYVSVILRILGLIKEPHATVDGLVKDMENSGWQKIDKLQKGAVIVWEPKNGHKHIGFYLGNKKVVSNNSKKKFPTIHSINYQKRKIIAIYHHEELA
jgi:hypothetical protein